MDSIAASAVIRPSRILFFLTMGMGLLSVIFGILVVAGKEGSFSLANETIVALLCIGSPFIALFSLIRKRKTLRIDISGIGQIRLQEYTEAALVSDERQSINRISEEEYRLTDGSTLWSGLLLLHLESSEGRKQIVKILPDSVSPDEFRSLYIACRWISARKNKGEKYF